MAVPGRPSLAAITGRGRAHRQRRLASFAGLGGASAAVVVALALGLAGVFGAAPVRTGTVQTAAFTLISYTNGIVALKLSQVFDPAALQRALAQHGVPALAKTGTYCSSIPAVPSPVGRGVLPGAARRERHRATPARYGRASCQTVNFPVKPSQLAPMVDPVSMVINPAAMPSGTELFIGYFDLGHTIVAGPHLYRLPHLQSTASSRPDPVARLDRPRSAGPA